MALLYMVFEIVTYYPSGGMDDCAGVFHTKEEALQCRKKTERKIVGFVPIFVLDTETCKYTELDEPVKGEE